MLERLYETRSRAFDFAFFRFLARALRARVAARFLAAIVFFRFWTRSARRFSMHLSHLQPIGFRNASK
jgi:hypothetical protein